MGDPARKNGMNCASLSMTRYRLNYCKQMQFHENNEVENCPKRDKKSNAIWSPKPLFLDFAKSTTRNLTRCF